MLLSLVQLSYEWFFFPYALSFFPFPFHFLFPFHFITVVTANAKPLWVSIICKLLHTNLLQLWNITDLTTHRNLPSHLVVKLTPWSFYKTLHTTLRNSSKKLFALHCKILIMIFLLTYSWYYTFIQEFVYFLIYLYDFVSK